ncbi:MAG: bifunctional 23S rRNA (guanine(2069)-N(7))-methyltransferase RlmK/23S rRNA (guanine(2445)-N(2))-methyltransferase RlmL [Spirochaetales bacterium]|uniref:Ribosomal RNA large subunit methyltransferase K/L n=1 Tax=Candidatus Thalassospirochaeta sargassi TaxID=3119039 RepID=A0AAJ1MJG2_9SPIO|nr:bifunctional 23S rRNA (guanine(2069)-N(7))-methyltransferase RlmK/23S rRNA (guanine(2445)-N(2))-methyltransferase RlmL [Spirochaetales bacterium]
MESFTFFATCPFYLEELLKSELESFGATDFQISHGGVGFNGGFETAYRACLWSRIANRILFPILSFDAEAPEDIRKASEGFEWENHFPQTSTFAVDATLTKTKICTPDYAALSVKDGIVDRARKLTGSRPNVDINNPDIRLHIHITLSRAAIAIDLSGEGLHKRGYRLETVRAGVRENTAAAVLMRGGWPELAAGLRQPSGTTDTPCFLDPMCGSGTLVTEAAMMAADIAPALNRRRFGFEKWLKHDEALWQKLRAEAHERMRAGLEAVKQASCGRTLFFGRDINATAVRTARTNIGASPVSELLRVGIIDVASGDFLEDGIPAALEKSTGNNGNTVVSGSGSRMLAVNPPYGERLNRDDDMIGFYRRMGEVLRRDYRGWKISLLTGHRELSDALGLRADKLNTVYNGGLRCTLAHFRMFNDKPAAGKTTGEDRGTRTACKTGIMDGDTGKKSSWPAYEELSPGSQMMYNRLKKNSKRLKNWLKKSGLSCYRLYDADMPEYSAAVDIYPPEVVIQEYMPPKTIDRVAASRRLDEAVKAVQSYLELPETSVKLKTRAKQRGNSQYNKKSSVKKLDPIANRRLIKEHELKFFIDTTTYLDTGIFLDSRPIRRLLREEANGKSFLNLFCYTGTASVYAASGGAISTTSVDTSKTYLEWAEANMKINNFRNDSHAYVKADCMRWLKNAVGSWDLIYLDPPTFSNSKDRVEIFDLQNDHEELIRLTVSKLNEDGVLIFCNNFRKFKLSADIENELDITEISGETIDPDFERKKNIHRCWRILKQKSI